MQSYMKITTVNNKTHNKAQGFKNKNDQISFLSPLIGSSFMFLFSYFIALLSTLVKNNFLAHIVVRMLLFACCCSHIAVHMLLYAYSYTHIVVSILSYMK